MQKNVLIVEPKSSSANVFSFFSYLPLLGPLYLGTVLKKAGFNVRFISENVLKRDLTDTELQADYLLLSCLTPTVQRGYEIAKRYKSVNSKGKVIIGGPHVTFMKEEAARYADHVVLGEGENIIVDLLTYGSDEKFVHGVPVGNLDNLPLIDWNIMQGFNKGGITPLMTSRGCPFACNFCSVAEMFGRRYRSMSPERVMEEVEVARKKHLFFYDDNFTADVNRAHKIMDLLAKSKRKYSWTAQVRSDVVRDFDLVRKMAMSGCDRVYIGFESINPNTLKKLKKSQTPEDISKAISILHAHGIKVHGMFMFGSETDDPKTVSETEKFVKMTKIDSVQYMVLTPLPGTELFEQMKNRGKIIHYDWKYYDALHVVFWPEQFSPLDLQNFAIDSFRSFYSLTNAANEIVDMFGDKFRRGLGIAYDKGVQHTYSFKNALFKAGGKYILNRWHKINKSYLSYLQQLSLSKTQDEPN